MQLNMSIGQPRFQTHLQHKPLRLSGFLRKPKKKVTLTFFRLKYDERKNSLKFTFRTDWNLSYFELCPYSLVLQHIKWIMIRLTNLNLKAMKPPQYNVHNVGWRRMNVGTTLCTYTVFVLLFIHWRSKKLSSARDAVKKTTNISFSDLLKFKIFAYLRHRFLSIASIWFSIRDRGHPRYILP